MPIAATVPDHHAADRIVGRLTAAGVPAGDIAVVSGSAQSAPFQGKVDNAHARGPRGLAIGAMVGALTFVVLGIAVIHALGLQEDANAWGGPIAVGAGMAIFGALVGALSGALLGLGVQTHAGTRAQGALDHGDVAVIVQADGPDRERLVRDVIADEQSATFGTRGAR